MWVSGCLLKTGISLGRGGRSVRVGDQGLSGELVLQHEAEDYLGVARHGMFLVGGCDCEDNATRERRAA